MMRKPLTNAHATELVSAFLMLQIQQASDREHFRLAQMLIEEMARWDVEESQRVGLDGSAIVEFFYAGKSEDALVRDCTPPDGCLILAREGYAVAGCGAFHRLDAGACELVYVYVRNEYRGQGIARRIVEQLVQMAANLGYETMRLETATFMIGARKLYASLGFAQRDPYRDIPSEFLPFNICMELALVGPRGPLTSAA